MTKHVDVKQLRFYRTNPAPCPYLPGQRERKVFTSLERLDAQALNDTLTESGFRRTQTIAYRPACDACNACISARAPVQHFVETRRWRRILAKNADLAVARTPALATEEQFWLLRRYLLGRHAGGGMTEMTMLDYAGMVEETPVRTHLVEYRYTRGPARGELAAAAIVDLLHDGLSLVYSFFDPDAPGRSLGNLIILDHIRQAGRARLPYLYLGYWVPGSEKMDYKGQFRPLEVLQGGAWRRLGPGEAVRG